MARAYADAGLRAVIAPAVADVPFVAAAWELARAVTPYLGEACRAAVARPYPINRYAEAAG